MALGGGVLVALVAPSVGSTCGGTGGIKLALNNKTRRRVWLIQGRCIRFQHHSVLRMG